MRIAVNTRFLIKDKLEGIGVFTFEIMKRFCHAHPEVEFILIFDRKPAPEFIFAQNVKSVIVYPPARHPFLWLIWYEFQLLKTLKKLKPDVFISMDGMLPLKLKIPSVAVIHDIAFETYPSAIPFLVRKFYHYFFPKYARRASKIVTVSGFSKNDLILKYGLPEDKIDVVYNGSKDVFKRIGDEKKNEVKRKYSDGNPYFLYAGSLHPRKNIIGLLNSFEGFKETDNQNFKLIIAGRKAWKTTQMEMFYEQMKYKSDVVFTGWISDTELAELTASAFAMIYISYFEGFGIPVLDAMKCGVPLIVSDSTSLPEVAGEAALYVKPDNYDEIAGKMKLLVGDDRLRRSLIEKGEIQSEKFSWSRSADNFASIILSKKY